ncbi:MAG: extracellular solute-binding protein, partial [Nitrospinota bacterium]
MDSIPTANRLPRYTRRDFLRKSATLGAVLAGGITFPSSRSRLYAGEKRLFEGVTLNLLLNAEPYAYAVRKHQQALYEKYGIRLNIELTGLGGPDYTKQMVEFTSGSGLYDIVFMSPVWMADFSPYMEPLEPLAKKWNLDFKLDDIAESFRKVYNSWDGVWYTVPFDGDVHILFYNKVAFETPEHKTRFRDKYGYELTPPQTWDQWRDMAEFFTGWDWMGGGGQKRYGG